MSYLAYLRSVTSHLDHVLLFVLAMRAYEAHVSFDQVQLASDLAYIEEPGT